MPKQKSHAERTALKIKRLEKQANDLFLKLSGNSPPDDSDLLKQKINEIHLKAEKIASPDFILSDRPDAIDQLKFKIERLRHLSAFFQLVNKTYKLTGNFEGIRISAHWQNEAQVNISAHGVPFPAQYFGRIRRMVKFCRDRIKALESGRYFKPYTVNGAEISLQHGRVVVLFKQKPTPETLAALKSLRLKWSPQSRAWVRKFTGQGDEFFEALQRALLTKK